MQLSKVHLPALIRTCASSSDHSVTRCLVQSCTSSGNFPKACGRWQWPGRASLRTQTLRSFTDRRRLALFVTYCATPMHISVLWSIFFTYNKWLIIPTITKISYREYDAQIDREQQSTYMHVTVITFKVQCSRVKFWDTQDARCGIRQPASFWHVCDVVLCNYCTTG